MKTEDQFGRSVTVPDDPGRIISLVPSQTELLADLDLDTRVVGITRFCERPKEWFYHKARIGGTKDPDLERISALKPDLIIGNAEENTKRTVTHLEQRYPVWLSDVKDLDSALDMIRAVGAMTHRRDRAAEWIERIREAFERWSPSTPPRRALYLIWKNPWMAVGRDTFINDMLNRAGFENVFTDPDSRYPRITDDEIEELKPEVILLSSEPFPFRQRDADELMVRYPGITALPVDGAAFSWYGTRLALAPRHFEEVQRALHEDGSDPQ